jgi:hypothetical protein
LSADLGTSVRPAVGPKAVQEIEIRGGQTGAEQPHEVVFEAFRSSLLATLMMPTRAIPAQRHANAAWKPNVHSTARVDERNIPPRSDAAF